MSHGSYRKVIGFSSAAAVSLKFAIATRCILKL